MHVSAEIFHIKQPSFKLNYPSYAHSSTSAHKKSLKFTINQLHNKIQKLQQIRILNKIWKRIYYAVAGITAVYGLADQGRLTQEMIGMVSGVNMSDIATKVGIETVDREMNKVNEWFVVENSSCI